VSSIIIVYINYNYDFFLYKRTEIVTMKKIKKRAIAMIITGIMATCIAQIYNSPKYYYSFKFTNLYLF